MIGGGTVAAIPADTTEMRTRLRRTVQVTVDGLPREAAQITPGNSPTNRSAATLSGDNREAVATAAW